MVKLMTDNNKKILADFLVADISFLSDTTVLMDLACERSLPAVSPGQFAQLEVKGDSEVFLRRPLSIHDVKDGHMYFLVQLVGPGTRALARLKKGDRINAILPLGNGFDISGTDGGRSLLVGGGVGMAPLLLLGRELKARNRDFVFLFGGRTSMQIPRLDEYGKLAPVALSTQDGSLGETGLVTDNSLFKSGDYDRIFCCGPTPMMKAVAAFAHERNIPCQVSLEHKMACGIGACLCCVEDTAQGNVCICKDGPVFDTRQLKWQI